MPEHKRGWLSNIVNAEQAQMWVAHCTAVSPDKVRKANGIDPSFSAVDILDDGDYQGERQLVYTFMSEEHPTRPPKGAVTFGWAKAGNYMYIFQPTLGATYVNHMGTMSRSKEITFPALIPFQSLTGFKIENGSGGLTLKPIGMDEGGGGCCFITTATCESLGLGDDCRQLQTLRMFRDQVLGASEQGRAAVQRYYASAPHIVAAIELQADRNAIYRDIYTHHLAPAIAAIGQGRHADAYSRYEALVVALGKRFEVAV